MMAMMTATAMVKIHVDKELATGQGEATFNETVSDERLKSGIYYRSPTSRALRRRPKQLGRMETGPGRRR